MGFNTSSIWIKVALVCLLLATLLFIIGFATISWMTSDRGLHEYGLWRAQHCSGGYACRSSSVSSHWLRVNGWTAWYRATQIFECIGLICVVMATIIILIFVFVDNMRRSTALLAVIIFSFAAALAMVIGFLIFGLNFDDYAVSVGWSMGLAIAASILCFVAGVMALIDRNSAIRITMRT